jgi:DNA-binding transcriptional regulator YiaG
MSTQNQAATAANEAGNTLTPTDLKKWRERLGLGAAGMSEYLGVPVHTWTKWENGTRAPDAAPRRLFELLGMLEAMAPAIHESLLPKK